MGGSLEGILEAVDRPSFRILVIAGNQRLGRMVKVEALNVNTCCFVPDNEQA
jgi:hypothetical protein